MLISSLFQRAPRTEVTLAGQTLFEIKTQTGAITKRYRRADYLQFIERFEPLREDRRTISFMSTTVFFADGSKHIMKGLH